MRALFALVLFVLAGLLSGCTAHDPDAGSVPWNRPASWEGQMPGMGMGGGL